MQLEETHRYDDIINYPHPVSAKRAGMSIEDRAAQFAPFSALTGYEDVIRETGRLTDSCTELTDSSLQMLNAQLCELAENPGMAVSVTWFQPDRVKSGGSYVVTSGCVKRIDTCHQILCMTDGVKIPLDAIRKIQYD